ncbi:hypothetical protein ANN_05199 [Periplaneta americana]|uniref:Uncharacterized protein n=1 Tax=Periplaneta americana TaxID=6978 RepID=A0ABQ8TCB2_PERAM|nr:hypothetical protein ANN_05199 [Periplaneta americana]
MAGLCESGNEPPGSLKASNACDIVSESSFGTTSLGGRSSHIGEEIYGNNKKVVGDEKEVEGMLTPQVMDGCPELACNSPRSRKTSCTYKPQSRRSPAEVSVPKVENLARRETTDEQFRLEPYQAVTSGFQTEVPNDFAVKGFCQSSLYRRPPEAADSLDRPPWIVVKRHWMNSATSTRGGPARGRSFASDRQGGLGGSCRSRNGRLCGFLSAVETGR